MVTMPRDEERTAEFEALVDAALQVDPAGLSGKYHADRPLDATEGEDPVSRKRVLYVNTAELQPAVVVELVPGARVKAKVRGSSRAEWATVGEPNGTLAVLLPDSR